VIAMYRNDDSKPDPPEFLDPVDAEQLAELADRDPAEHRMYQSNPRYARDDQSNPGNARETTS
jgi:hypothetical protein